MYHYLRSAINTPADDDLVENITSSALLLFTAFLRSLLSPLSLLLILPLLLLLLNISIAVYIVVSRVYTTFSRLLDPTDQKISDFARG